MAIHDSSRGFSQLVEFAVEPHHQPGLVAELAEQAERFTRTYQGFISASVQASDDGYRVLNYVQWHSKEACETACRGAGKDALDISGLIKRYQAKAVTFGTFQVVSLIESGEGQINRPA
jgi:Antibiotic biosynthesis monooxygenase